MSGGHTLEAIEALVAGYVPVPVTLPTERGYLAPVGLSEADAAILAALCSDPAMAALSAGDLGAYGGDHSSGDLAFCTRLARPCGRNPDQIERIWLATPLGQRIGKPPKAQTRPDYRARTIEKACEHSTGRVIGCDPSLVDFTPFERTMKANASRYKLLNSAAVAAMTPVEFFLQGIFPEKGVCGIYGPVAGGKSFLASYLAECGSVGASFFGRRVKCKPVVYVVLEGEGGFQRRIKVQEIKRGQPLPDNFRLVVMQSFRLNSNQDIADLAEAIKAEFGSGAVVFIDTFNRSFPDMDENSSKDMGIAIGGAKELQSLIDGLVILVHHVGKDASKGLRGHSSLIAALDGAIEIKRDKDARSWTVAKSKDGDDSGDPVGFKLRTIYIGPDDYGDLVGSCVVEPCETEIRARDLNPSTGKNEKLVLEALRPLLCEAGVHGLSLATAIDTAGRCLVVDDKRRRERTQAALTGLASKGILRVQDGQLWLA